MEGGAGLDCRLEIEEVLGQQGERQLQWSEVNKVVGGEVSVGLAIEVGRGERLWLSKWMLPVALDGGGEWWCSSGATKLEYDKAQEQGPTEFSWEGRSLCAPLGREGRRSNFRKRP